MYPQIHLSSGFSLSTYFLVISLATLVAVLWFIRRAEKVSLRRVVAIDLALTVLISGFIGARLLHVIYEEPEFYSLNPLAVLQIWNGGFVFLGGVIGGFIGGVIFCRLKGEPFWYWADIGAPPIALAYALGRFACFLNGCCYGKVCELPWAVFLHGAHRHPTQLYSAFWDLSVLGFLLLIEKRLKLSGLLFNLWVIAMSLGRLLMEHFRDDPRGPVLLGASLGTVMSVVLIFMALTNIVASELQSR